MTNIWCIHTCLKSRCLGFFLQQITSVTTKVKGQRFTRRSTRLHDFLNSYFKYLGWDFLRIQWVDSDISGEILPLYIERIQISQMRLVSLYALSRLKYLHIPVSRCFTCIYQYLECDCPCLQTLIFLVKMSPFTLSEFVDSYQCLYHL